MRYWEDFPPVNEAFASFIGHKRRTPAAEPGDPFENLMRDFQGLG